MQETLLSLPDGSSARISEHGANVLSWKTSDGRERLFLSRTALHEEGAPIRGGVPIIFPQFGGTGPLRHGFVRTTAWKLQASADDAVSYVLVDNAATRACWSHEFRLLFTLRLEPQRLTLTLRIENPGASGFDFTCALHTYLRVGEISAATVQGLKGRPFWNAVTDERLVDTDDSIYFSGMLDRVYPDAAPCAPLLSSDLQQLQISSTGFPDLVIWNPGEAAAAKLADLHPQGFQEFVCVESALAERPFQLAAGEAWEGSQTLSVPPAQVDIPHAIA